MLNSDNMLAVFRVLPREAQVAMLLVLLTESEVSLEPLFLHEVKGATDEAIRLSFLLGVKQSCVSSAKRRASDVIGEDLPHKKH